MTLKIAGVGADAERERERSPLTAKPGRAPHLPDREPDVLHEVIERDPASRIAREFADARRIAERAPRRRARVVGGRAGRALFFGFEVQVGLDLALQVVVGIGPAGHTGFSSRPTARTSDAHLDSSIDSCFLPAAVSR